MKALSSFLLLFTLVLSGCTTVDFVRKDLTPEKRAIVRYPPQSKPESESKYRAELESEATEFCGGPYEITREYEQLTETPGTTGIGTGLGFGYGRRGFGTGLALGTSFPQERTYHYVELACGKAEEAKSTN